jgi:CDP-4-dehydro-6-deoxyglucose reductase
MRSIHRYATDGMILTMLLHMVRHFAFDKLPRLPLVLLGDRRHPDLADVHLRHQRLHAGVGQAGAVRHRRHRRMLDWIPMFNGVVIRNFIFEGTSTTACSPCSPSSTSARR